MTGLLIEYSRQNGLVMEWCPGLEVHGADRGVVRQLTPTADGDLESGDLAGLDVGRTEMLLDPLQAIGVEARCLGVRGRVHGVSLRRPVER